MPSGTYRHGVDGARSFQWFPPPAVRELERARLPENVAQMLRWSPGARYRIRIPGVGGVWNPANGAQLDFRDPFGPGYATYLLDDAGTVHFWFEGDGGARFSSTGPLVQPVPFHRRRRRPDRQTVILLLTILSCAAGGFVIALLTASGTAHHRLHAGVVGAAIGAASSSVVLFGVLIVYLILLALRSTFPGTGPLGRSTGRSSGPRTERLRRRPPRQRRGMIEIGPPLAPPPGRPGEPRVGGGGQ